MNKSPTKEVKVPKTKWWVTPLVILAVVLMILSIYGPPKRTARPVVYDYLETPTPKKNLSPPILPFGAETEEWVVCGDSPCVLFEVLGAENCTGEWRVIEGTQSRLSFKGFMPCFVNCISGPNVLVDEDCGIPDKDHDGDVDLRDFMRLQECGPGFTQEVSGLPD